MTRPLRPAAWDDVPRAALPALWVLAGMWVWLTSAARALHDLLDVGERLHEAAGRATVRAARGALRALGPLGRSLRRMAMPALTCLRDARRAVGQRLLAHVVLPLARASVTAWERSGPVRRRLVAMLVRLAVRARPLLLLVLAYMTRLLRDAGARLVVLCRRAWAPVLRAARDLRRLLPG